MCPTVGLVDGARGPTHWRTEDPYAVGWYLRGWGNQPTLASAHSVLSYHLWVPTSFRPLPPPPPADRTPQETPLAQEQPVLCAGQGACRGGDAGQRSVPLVSDREGGGVAWLPACLCVSWYVGKELCETLQTWEWGGGQRQKSGSPPPRGSKQRGCICGTAITASCADSSWRSSTLAAGAEADKPQLSACLPAFPCVQLQGAVRQPVRAWCVGHLLAAAAAAAAWAAVRLSLSLSLSYLAALSLRHAAAAASSSFPAPSRPSKLGACVVVALVPASS